MPPSEFNHVLISSRDRAVSLVLDSGKTFTFDPAGRLVALTAEGRCYLRGLDGRVKEKSWDGAKDEFDRYIRDLSTTETHNLYSDLNRDLQSIRRHVSSGGAHEFRIFQNGAGAGFRNSDDLLARLLLWDPDRLTQDAEQFHAIYSSIGILPPDQYFALIVQIVEGCPWNKCTFCNFYSKRPFRIRPIDEVLQHVEDIAAFLGNSVRLRRSVFLSDANALTMATRDLLPIVRAIRKRFPDQTNPPGGIYTFADVPAILGKAPQDLSELGREGLRRVYIGMESGSDEIRALILKPGRKKDLIRAVLALKEAQLEVGLIVLLGVGGVEFGDRHVDETTAAIKKMGLGRKDIVYFSPFFPSIDTDYVKIPSTTGLTALGKDGIRKQYHDFLRNLGFSKEGCHPTTAVYDIREFVV